jgi:hypothetical protein
MSFSAPDGRRSPLLVSLVYVVLRRVLTLILLRARSKRWTCSDQSIGRPAITDEIRRRQTGTARELRRAELRDHGGRLTGEAPVFLEDLLAATPGIVLQLEVRAHADTRLAGRTIEAVEARLRVRTRGRRVELMSFATAACARAAGPGCPARLVVWADYAPAALVRWARRHGVGGVCVEHFLLSDPLVSALRAGGLSVTTGTIDEPALLERVLHLRPDAVTSDRPHALRRASAATPRWPPDQSSARSSVPRMRGWPSITGLASILASAKPASVASALSPPTPKPQ